MKSVIRDVFFSQTESSDEAMKVLFLTEVKAEGNWKKSFKNVLMSLGNFRMSMSLSLHTLSRHIIAGSCITNLIFT